MNVVKRIVSAIVLIPLGLFEIYLCMAFLPVKWQLAINDRITSILPSSPDWEPVTHPVMSQEIEQVLHEHVGLRVALFTITIALMVGNAWLIRRLWRLVVRRKSSEGQ
jgi:hypothetical protein